MKLDPDAETRIAELARRTFPRGWRVLLRPFARASLSQAVLHYKEEVQRAARDKARARNELERALKLADQLSAQMSDLSEDTLSISIQAGPLIGVQKGPLWRDVSWPEAA